MSALRLSRSTTMGSQADMPSWSASPPPVDVKISSPGSSVPNYAKAMPLHYVENSPSAIEQLATAIYFFPCQLHFD